MKRYYYTLILALTCFFTVMVTHGYAFEGRDLVWKSTKYSNINRVDTASSGSLAWNGSRYIVARGEGNKGSIWTSTDGESWEKVFSYSKQLHGAAWDGKQFIVVGAQSILISQDGIKWTESLTGHKGWFYAVEYNGSRLVAVGYDGSIVTSMNGVKWEDADYKAENALTDILWDGKQFIAIGSKIITSQDGIHWTKQNIDPVHRLNRVSWNGVLYVAVGNNGLIYTSEDGYLWTQRESNTTKFIESIVWDGKRFIALGSDLMLFSENGIMWSEVDSNIKQHIYDLHWNGYKYVGAVSLEVGIVSIPFDIIKVKIDEKPIIFDVVPTILNDTTLVPLRAVFESLGAEVKWNDKTQSVTLTKGGTVIILHIDNNDVIINGEHKLLEVSPAIVSGRTFIPIRFVSESLGAKVMWNGETKTVAITSK